MAESNLSIAVQTLKRVDLVAIVGRVDSNIAPELDGTLKGILEQGRSNIVLELTNVDYMSSAGLRALVSALRESKKKGGDVRLAAPSERVVEVLSLAGLDALFTSYEDSTTAVGSF